MEDKAEEEIKSTEVHENYTISISLFVQNFLIVLGLIAEWMAIKSIIELAIPGISGLSLLFTNGSVVLMLIHQFLIIRNFHILDHINCENYPIGDWVSRCRWEDFLRFILFLLFSALTGEIVYLFIVSSKSVTIFHELITDENNMYNLSWITPIYLISALIMAIVMLIWDILGLCHDWDEVPKLEYRKWHEDDKIVYYPFSSPYYTFIISDFVALYFWLLVNYLIFFKTNKDNIMLLFAALFLLYITSIATRLWGEYKVNKRKITLRFENYKRNTFWWRKKSNT